MKRPAAHVQVVVSHSYCGDEIGTYRAAARQSRSAALPIAFQLALGGSCFGVLAASRERLALALQSPAVARMFRQLAWKLCLDDAAAHRGAGTESTAWIMDCFGPTC
jgi:hypothetical protein